ncbi:MAG TPA: M48 family metallopeptidase, partial [Pirellulales bacterium]|nr:M48 family metallopeptidase [Pirellulales bacterium]
VKRNLLGVGFGLPLMLGLYGVIHWTGGAWWAWTAGIFFIISIVLGQLMPVLILPLFYKVAPLDNPALGERMGRLAAGTGLRIDGLYRMELSAETVKANAMLAGLGNTRRVILGDTLLDGFSPDEIEVILAHEIGHHVHRHIPKLIGIGLVFSAVGFWLCDWVLRSWLRASEGRFEPADYQHLPVYTLPLFLLWTTGFSTVMQPLQNTISRFFERQCDRYALRRTGLRAAYRSAFQKLAKLNKEDPSPPALEVLLFHSHPPISERLRMADETAA